jgi:hypothetical protein
VAAIIQTPALHGQDAIELSGGTWRKRLLPVGTVDYKGRALRFDRDYLERLAAAFSSGAYDQVPFQLADSRNSHTNDPERFRGEVRGMTVADDGLWVTISTTEAGNALLELNPRLGVSARIVEDYARSDGEYYPAAIQHVLGTLDPRIPGMGGWEAVAASNDAEVTFDLSGEQFTREEPGIMPELTTEQQEKLARLLDLDPDKLSALAAIDPAALAAAGGTEPPGDGGGDAEIDDIAAMIDAMTDDELAAWEASLEAEPAPEPAPAGLSSEAALALELAQATGDENARQLQVITEELDRERWAGERARLLAGGVPPVIADLAQPLLQGAGHVVDLAGGKTVDAGQIMRAVLAEYSKIGQQLGIGVELGTSADEPDADGGAAATAREELVTRARAQMFGLR